MTYKEIIKALDCCTTKGAKCSDCPAFKKVDRSDCKKHFRGAIDLINHQKAEIERLKKKVEELSEVLSDSIRIKYKEAQLEAIEEFAESLKEEWFNNRYDSPDIDFDYFIDLNTKKHCHIIVKIADRL